jgi:ubiquinone/menaquinone biosynthesis C-methylase UbiE
VDLLSLLLLESALSFQQDYRAISNGLYKAPWDMTTPGHRQNTPQYAAQQTLRFIEEAAGTLGRGASQKEPGIWLKSDFYPGYYKNDFHYQTDGWMSKRSAEVYETSTEVVFLGRQDAMQRLSLLPLREVRDANNGKPRILEVASGTGRFTTFIRDNHPTADVTLVDLSPFYLEAARENDQYWRTLRYPNEESRPPPATFVQAAAEALPFEDASFDAVVCVYLFHEMPEAARAAAAAEMARVVAPGGTVVLTDSMQRGDRFLLTSTAAKAFGKLNEPHVENYVDTDISSLFTSRNLKPDGKWLESVTKTLSFRKPLAA